MSVARRLAVGSRTLSSSLRSERTCRSSLTEDARVEAVPSGDLAADDAHIYGRELYDAECLAATRLAQLLGQDTPLFKPEELEAAMARAKEVHAIVLEADQRRRSRRR